MFKYFYKFLYAGSLLCLLSQPVWAQNSSVADLVSSMLDSTERQSQINQDIAGLIQDNKTLSERYRLFNERYQELKNQIAVFEDNFRLERERAQALEARQNIDTLRQTLEQKRSAVLLKESKISYLMGQLLDLDEQKQTQELSEENLKYEHQRLSKEYQRKFPVSQKKQKEWEQYLTRLKEQIDLNNQKTEELSAQTAQLNNEGLTFEQKIRVLQTQNELVRLRIEELNIKKDIQQKDNLILKDQLALAARGSQNTLLRKREVHKVLVEEVAQLRTKVANLSNIAKVSLNRQEQRRNLIDTIMQLDAQNRKLQSKIDQIQEQIASLESRFITSW